MKHYKPGFNSPYYVDSSRSSVIDGVVERLQAEYGIPPVDRSKLLQLAKNNGIEVYFHRQVLAPKGYMTYDGERIRQCVVLPDWSSDFSLSHEFGHCILGHFGKARSEAEKEAEYFAKKLMRLGYLGFVRERTVLIIKTVLHNELLKAEYERYPGIAIKRWEELAKRGLPKEIIADIARAYEEFVVMPLEGKK